MRLLAESLLLMVTALSLCAMPLRDVCGATVTLPDTNGKEHLVGAPVEGRAAVLFFAGVECPACQYYLPRVIELCQSYQTKGIAFYAVYSNALDKPSDIAKQATACQAPFPFLLDPDQEAADAFHVVTTPTAVLIDSQGKVRYRGLIDDNKVSTLIGKHYLKDAIEAVLLGKEVPATFTPCFGCRIQRKLIANEQSQVTYSKQIAAILNEHCVTCHRPGQLGPFPLQTYEQTRRVAENIKIYTQSGAMPPWKPLNHGMFRGERWLPQEQIDLLARWVDSGAPLGNPGTMPSSSEFPEDWTLGRPDLVLEAPEYEVSADGNDEYRCFVIDPHLDESRDVIAVEFVPGNRRVVHHVMTYIDPLGSSSRRDGQDGHAGYSSSGAGPGFVPLGDLGGWAPGGRPLVLPDGTGRLLPRGAKIVLEVHYHKDGQVEKDHEKFGLYFSKKPVQRHVYSQIMVNDDMAIPAGAKHFPVMASWDVFCPLHVIAIQPHMHLLGHKILVVAHLPDKTDRILIRIDDWDFNQQEMYVYAEPIALPRGTHVEMTCWFDNSVDNPNNPHKPPRDVKFGEQTADEMDVAYIVFSPDKDE